MARSSARRALIRTLKSAGADIHVLADRVEHANGDGLTDGRALLPAQQRSTARPRTKFHRRHGITHSLARADAKTGQMAEVNLLSPRRKAMTGAPAIDEAAIRRFLSIIHEHAARASNGSDDGALQFDRFNPLAGQPSRAASRSAISIPW